MGNFDFGQFKQIYDYLTDKLNDGGALTPEEKQVYDMLIGFANQGLNLTESADFNSLYTAFNSLADAATKAEFERLYGENLFQDPETGQITFTKPGALIEQFMRRGLSVNDGPVIAALSEGLKEFTRRTAANKFSSMTNAYGAMTPIRGQNIQSATNAGNVASTAIGRRVPVAGAAVSGGVAAGGEGEGEPISIDTRGGEGEPSFLDKFGPALFSLLGTAGLGVGGYLLKEWWDKRNKSPNGDDDEGIDRNAEERPPGWQGSDLGVSASLGPNEFMDASTYGGGFYPSLAGPSSLGSIQSWGTEPAFNPYVGDVGSFGTEPMGAYTQQQWGTEPQGSSYQTPAEPNYQDFYQPQTGPSSTEGWNAYYDSGGYDPWSGGGQGGEFDTGYWDQPTYDSSSWSGDTSGGYWV